MAAEKILHIDEEGELADALRYADTTPVVVLFEGRRYRIAPDRDPRLPVVDVDAQDAIWNQLSGIFKDDPGFDAREVNAEIDRLRDDDHSGST